MGKINDILISTLLIASLNGCAPNKIIKKDPTECPPGTVKCLGGKLTETKRFVELYCVGDSSNDDGTRTEILSIKDGYLRGQPTHNVTFSSKDRNISLASFDRKNYLRGNKSPFRTYCRQK